MCLCKINIFVYILNKLGGKNMNGNRLYREPNDWQTGDVITKAKMNKIELGLLAIAKEIIDAAGGDNMTLSERLDSMFESLNNDIANMSIDPDDLSLEQDPETGLVYPVYRGVRSENGIPLAGGGGGGGGGSSSNEAVLTLRNTSGWISKSIPQDASCLVNFTWSSIENNIETGDGILSISISNVVKALMNVHQGDNTVDIGPYLSIGANSVLLRITDAYDNTKVIRYNINVSELKITSSFDTSVPFNDDITFPYTPIGNAAKSIHFEIDGVELPVYKTNVNGDQLSQIIPAQNHGAHVLRAWITAMLNGESVSSNVLYYEFISLGEGNNNPIIASSFNTTEVNQYETVIIPYRIYVPNSTEAEVSIFLNGSKVAELTVDRTEQSFSFRANRSGANTVQIRSGVATKSFNISVTASPIVVEAVSEGLQLHLNAQGRSNGEAIADRANWASTVGNTTATLSGFNWRLNGWLNDTDGVPILRLSDTARVTIPFKIFEQNFIETGKTVEIEFATREVSNYSANIITCWTEDTDANDVTRTCGLKITPQEVTFKGYQTTLNTVYKDNEHVRLSITVGKQGDYKLMLLYINGIMSRAIQYADGERFSQLTPVNISIGSSDCGVDIYNIRVYNTDLNRRQVLNNWIADTQIGSLLVERYTRNDVYNDSGVITTETLPNDLPYFIYEALELPQYKGDKKTITGSYTDKVNPSKSFTFAGCQINVQGTSSAPYYRKNYDMQFKQGFVTNTGSIDKYALRTNSIPFNRFVLKADVASSESANNTELVMFYNDTCPYKTPEMIADDRVRWGIEGIPSAVFWYNTDTQETEFMGKYNFNLPKRAPAPYGYGDDDTLESWEWERNNSENVKFQDNDFVSQSWDEENQQWYPTWYDDFEARFPKDTFRDYTKLNTFISFVKSTDRANATNETLSSPVTYTVDSTATVDNYSEDLSYTVVDNGPNSKTITFTKDTPAYRLTKFKAEFPNYAELDSFVFYYLFTEMFTMIDSRAKNMFIGFNGGVSNTPLGRKATAQPYDMDTAVGTNNSGVLMFGYSLEDTDTVSGLISGSGSGGSNAPVFNAQDSVLWINVRDAFRARINNMYTNLRADNKWSYSIVENRYEAHQAKWPEAIFNEDAWVKYIIPLVNPVTFDEELNRYIRTDRYLTMLQGSKTEQRKWWLYNRFRYMDSKFNTGDAANRVLTMRIFHSGTLTITPAIDMYVAVRFGAGTTPAMRRTTANTAVSFPYTVATGVQEMETLILSGDLITDVGDLSVFYPNELEFSRATRLKNLKIGDSAAGYSNPNLTTLDVSNSALLEKIDCRNCPNLAITVNLEGSPRLKEAYFEGTSITGVDLVDGGALEKLHLPNTITTLTLLNLDKLSDLVVPSYTNITRLMLANMPNSVINPITVLSAMPANSQVNIQGLYLEATDADDIEDIFDLFDTMRGVTREKNTNGVWIYHDYDTAQISGTIHTTNLTGAQIASFNARYPYIRVTADNVVSYLKYYTYDGSSLEHTETIINGADGTWNGAPTRTSTAQYDFAFSGWSTTMNDTVADPNATKGVLGDRDVYAVYTATVRTYTVTWKGENNTTLETDTNVPYGTIPQYNGSTPTSSTGSPFTGWTPTVSAITGDVTYTAGFKPVYTITFKNDNGTTLQTLTGVVEGTVPSYTGTTPVSSNGNDYEFIGWNPTIVAATANATYTAKYEAPDPWPEVNAAIKDGSYTTKYNVGDTVKLVLDNGEYSGTATIVGIDKDVDAEGNTIPLTFITTNTLNTTKAMNSSNTNTNGYPATNVMKPWVDNLKSHMPTTLQLMIKAASKTSYNNTTNSDLTNNLELWIPSVREVFSASEASNSRESSGVDYNDVFNSNNARKKTGGSTWWWLRSARASSSSSFRRVASNGSFDYLGASSAYGVVLGFCVGATRSTPIDYDDTWDDVDSYIADGSYKTRYIPGDTVAITIGTEYTGRAQVVAIDADVDENGNTIPITWMTKNCLNTTHNMNDTNTNSGGYPASSMKTYVDGLLTSMPAKVQSMIVPAVKTSYNYNNSSTNYSGVYSLWIPSVREMFTASEASDSRENRGPTYTELFNGNSARIKQRNGSNQYYWLRSARAGYSSNFRVVSSNGYFSYGNASSAGGVVLGWCTKATT